MTTSSVPHPPIGSRAAGASDGSAARPGGIAGLSELHGRYDVVFCDVWGVVHDGERKHPEAEAALGAARLAGAKVVLLTNSPRPAAGVVAQLDTLGFSRSAYDAVVTSGDATRVLIDKAGGPVFHLGPDRDADLFEGLAAERVGEEAATAVVATGLLDDEHETPDDYAPLLKRLKARDLPMICANPDIVVHRGDRLIFCAGALARDYEALGGIVRLAGKPHGPIYEVAAAIASARDKSRILAIGDGLLTDIKGANGYGVDALLITDGVHGEEFGGPKPDAGRVEAVLAARGLTAAYFLATLS